MQRDRQRICVHALCEYMWNCDLLDTYTHDAKPSSLYDRPQSLLLLLYFCTWTVFSMWYCSLKTHRHKHSQATRNGQLPSHIQERHILFLSTDALVHARRVKHACRGLNLFPSLPARNRTPAATGAYVFNNIILHSIQIVNSREYI